MAFMTNLSKMFISFVSMTNKFPHGEHFLFTMRERCKLYFIRFRVIAGNLTPQTRRNPNYLLPR